MPRHVAVEEPVAGVVCQEAEDGEPAVGHADCVLPRRVQQVSGDEAGAVHLHHRAAEQVVACGGVGQVTVTNT